MVLCREGARIGLQDQLQQEALPYLLVEQSDAVRIELQRYSMLRGILQVGGREAFDHAFRFCANFDFLAALIE